MIRAGLVTAVAAGVDGGLLDEQIAYVTSDPSFRTPFARGYRVLEELPYREKPLKAALRERGVGRLTIKKRGVDVVPEQLRKRLALAATRTATIVLTRVGGHGTLLSWCRRSEAPSGSPVNPLRQSGRARGSPVSLRDDQP